MQDRVRSPVTRRLLRRRRTAYLQLRTGVLLRRCPRPRDFEFFSDGTMEHVLADGSAPATPDELLDRLRKMGIEATTYRHDPVFTVEEAQTEKGDLPGAHTKNLFLRDKKGAMWLLVALHDREVDLLALASKLDVRGRLSFGSASRLMRYLGVTAGSVTPFALVNDHGRKVSVALGDGLRRREIWNAHPLDNSMTTAVSREDMLRFLDAVEHPPVWVKL